MPMQNPSENEGEDKAGGGEEEGGHGCRIPGAVLTSKEAQRGRWNPPEREETFLVVSDGWKTKSIVVLLRLTIRHSYIRLRWLTLHWVTLQEPLEACMPASFQLAIRQLPTSQPQISQLPTLHLHTVQLLHSQPAPSRHLSLRSRRPNQPTSLRRRYFRACLHPSTAPLQAIQSNSPLRKPTFFGREAYLGSQKASLRLRARE